MLANVSWRRTSAQQGSVNPSEGSSRLAQAKIRPMDLITRIGFFHYGKHHSTPLDAFRVELEKLSKDAIKGALVVLPEGFNLGRCYHDATIEPTPEPDIIEKLHCLTHDYEFAIV